MLATVHYIKDAKRKIYMDRLDCLELDIDRCMDDFSKAMMIGTSQDTHRIVRRMNELDKEIHKTKFELNRHKGKV